jgi:integrase/recombinase XerD
MDFALFLREKQYLENVSPNTLRWYRHALKWLPAENPDEQALKDMVIRMREAGLKETGCNAAIRAINCYLRWSGSPHAVRQLKERAVVPPIFTTEQIKWLTSYKPRTAFQHRLHLLIMVLFDNGCRVSEALELRSADVDLDNLLITVHGKGRKDRKVPMSFELRKALFKYRRGEGLLFTTANGTPWGRIGALRSIKLHCRKLGFEPPARTLHAMRHTFALNYLRKGGSVFHLQKILGHSTLEMTRRYANLLTEDLQAIHQRVSLLAA